MGSHLIDHVLPRATVLVEVYNQRDVQGRPSYQAGVQVSVIAKEEDSHAVNAEGATVQTNLTVWTPHDQAPVPRQQDRLTHDGVTFIGVEVKAVRTIGGALTHHRTKLRRERRGG